MRSESPGRCEGVRRKQRNMAWELGLSIGRLPRVRPLLRFESSSFFNPKMRPPQRRMAFVGKRKCQATGGIFCLQEMERCGLCVDEN